MKAVTLKMKKTARLRVVATPAKTQVKFPRQTVGTVALQVQIPSTVFQKGQPPRTVYLPGKILRQWDLVLHGDELRAVKVT